MVSPRKVLVLDPIAEAGLELLRSRPDITLTHLTQPTPEAIAHELKDTWALLIRARVLDPALWREAGALRLVSRHGVGCDNLPLDTLAELGIAVAIAADSNTTSVAEHTMMLMLALARRALAYDRATRDGRFAHRESLDAVDLSGRTLLIVGLGRIGQQVARRARAFDMRVIGYDAMVPADVAPEAIERIADLETALGVADVVTLHIPRTPQTVNLIDAVRLAQMKPEALLINAARGRIVDEAALCSALEEGRIAGAALDVFAQEPVPVDHPLLKREDVLLSPHSAAMTPQGAARMSRDAAANILAFLDGTLAPQMLVVPAASR